MNMKKNKIFIGLVLFLFLGNFEMDAQEYMGIRAGLNYSNIAGIHKNSKERLGYQIGVHAMFKLSQAEHWYLQPEVAYSAIGEYNQPISPDGEQMKQRIFLDYLQVPILIKLYPWDRETGVFLEGGPYVGYNINTTTDSYYFETLPDHSTYNKLDFGGVGGIGISFNKRWEASLRAYVGILNQIENPEVDTKALNLVANIGVSYNFGTSSATSSGRVGGCKF